MRQRCPAGKVGIPRLKNGVATMMGGGISPKECIHAYGAAGPKFQIKENTVRDVTIL
jgi:hypothetical protein